MHEGININILTGPIQTGKTTSLIQWIKNRTDVYGILTPVIEGKRCFMDAYSKEIFSMEAIPNEENIIKVGKYNFSKPAFDRAIQILQDASSQSQRWIIIDEIGMLELNGQGFDESLKKILNKTKNFVEIILVIRESLLGPVLLKYGIKRYSLFDEK